MIAQKIRNAAATLDVMVAEGTPVTGAELRNLADSLRDWSDRIQVLETQPVPRVLRSGGGDNVVALGKFKETKALRARLCVVMGGGDAA